MAQESSLMPKIFLFLPPRSTSIEILEIEIIRKLTLGLAGSKPQKLPNNDLWAASFVYTSWARAIINVTNSGWKTRARYLLSS